MSDEPKQPIRSDSIYLSFNVRQGLRLAAIKTGRGSSDELADLVLSTWLAQEHPDIHKHLSDREARDKAFRDGLKPRIPFA